MLRGGVRAGYIGLGFTSLSVMVEAIDKVKAVHKLCRKKRMKSGIMQDANI